MFLLIFILSLLSFQEVQLQIENAWIRPSSKGMNSALYFDVKNNSDDPASLYKVESDLGQALDEAVEPGGAGRLGRARCFVQPDTPRKSGP